MSVDEGEYDSVTTNDNRRREGKKPLAEQITLWVGVIGTLVTITLTILNARTSSKLQEKQVELQNKQAEVQRLEIDLKARAE